MMDEFAKLKAGLQKPPAPDPQARDRALQLAMANFERLHQAAASNGQTTEQSRPSKPPSRVQRAWHKWQRHLSGKPAWAGYSSLAALFVGLAVILPISQSHPPVPPAPGVHLPAPAQAPISALPGPTETAAASPLATTAARAKMPYAATIAAGDPVLRQAAPGSTAPTPSVAPQLERAPAPPSQRRSLPAENAIAANESVAADPPLAPAPAAEAQAAEAQAAALPTAEAPIADAKALQGKMARQAVTTLEHADADPALWSRLRRALRAGQMPPAASLDLPALINHFSYTYAAPAGDQPLRLSVAVMPTPWNPATRLVRVGVQAATPEASPSPGRNLVLLLDRTVAGQTPEQQMLLWQSLDLLLQTLRPEDQIAIVTGSAAVALPPTAATKSGAIQNALDALQAEPPAPISAEGFEAAYALAREMQHPGTVSQLLLVAEGGLRLAPIARDSLLQSLATAGQSGISVSVLGLGARPLDAAFLAGLRQSGVAVLASIGTLPEARQHLAALLDADLRMLAEAVTLELRWNPATVAEYRLIGQETPRKTAGQGSDEPLNLGRIGAGQQVTVLYEIAAPGTAGLRTAPPPTPMAAATNGAGPSPDLPGSDMTAADAASSDLASSDLPSADLARSEMTEAAPRSFDPKAALASLDLRWKMPGDDHWHSLSAAVTETAGADAEAGFAAALAGFGLLLRGSATLAGWSWEDAIALAHATRGEDAFGQRDEAITLMGLAKALAQ